MARLTGENRALIRKLTQATRQGRVRWEPASPSQFVIPSKSGNVSVRSADADDTHPYVFVIENPDGVPIVTAETMVGERYADWEVEIADLFAAARDSALGVTEVIQGLATELGLDDISDPDDIPF